MIDWDDEAGHFRIHWARLADPARHAIAQAVELQQARVLDVGCGNGDFCALALERGAQVSGIDAAPAMIATAKERAPDADLRVGEMDALPYADGAFDLVTGFNSLQFSDDPVAALREWMRVGRHGRRLRLGRARALRGRRRRGRAARARRGDPGEAVRRRAWRRSRARRA